MQKSSTKLSDEGLASPLVTIYLPTYNRVALLKRAVSSVLCQSFQDIELIVVDDQSTDSTVEYLESLSANENKVRWFVNETNSGACFSRNKAIKEARGAFVTGLDDDDYFAPNHIESLLRAWRRRNKGVVAIYPNTIRVNQDEIKHAAPKLGQCFADDLLHNNWIGNQVFLPVRILREIGGFDERFPAWQDYECWYRLLARTGMKAECSKSYTYYLDASHGQGRISSLASEKIYFSWRMFCDKHNLSAEDASIVKLMLLSYGIKEVDRKYIIRKVLIKPDYKNLKHSVVLFLKYYGMI